MNKHFRKLLSLILCLNLVLTPFINSFASLNENDGMASESLEESLDNRDKDSAYESNDSSDDESLNEENSNNTEDINEDINKEEINILSDNDKSLIEKYRNILEENKNTEDINLDLKTIADKLVSKTDDKLDVSFVDEDLQKGFLGLSIKNINNENIKKLKLSLNNNISLVKSYYSDDQVKKVENLLLEIDKSLDEFNNSENIDLESYQNHLNNLIKDLSSIEPSYSLDKKNLEVQNEINDSDKNTTNIDIDKLDKGSDLELVFKVGKDILDDTNLNDLIKIQLEDDSQTHEISIEKNKEKEKNDELPNRVGYYSNHRYVNYSRHHRDDKYITIKKEWSDPDIHHDPINVKIKYSCVVGIKDKSGGKKYINFDNQIFDKVSISSKDTWFKKVRVPNEKELKDELKKNPEALENYAGINIKKIREVSNLRYKVIEDKMIDYKSEVKGNENKGFTITNTKINDEVEKPRPKDLKESKIDLRKKIDYLGDKGDNPDTKLKGEDFYRHYLEIEGEKAENSSEPSDYLILVDTSSSMDTLASNGEYKDNLSTKLLNGGLKNSSKDGLLTKLLSLNPKNKACVMTFAGNGRRDREANYSLSSETYINYDWHGLEKNQVDNYTWVYPNNGVGTNYCTALYRASSVFNDRKVRNDGNKKVLILISDGKADEYVDYFNEYYQTVRIPGLNSYIDSNQIINYNNKAYDYLKKKVNSDIEFHSISIDCKDNSLFFRNLTNKAKGQMHLVNNSEDIKKVSDKITGIAYPNSLYLEDNLSKYVNLEKESLDFKIKLIKDKTEKLIWEGGLGSYNSQYNYTPVGHAVNGGENIIDWASISENYKDNKDRIQVQFNPDYDLKDEKIQVSFNIKANKDAKNYKKNNKTYPDTGDEGTDFEINSTSSKKKGLLSSDDSSLSFKQKDLDKKLSFPKSVIQVKDEKPLPTPPKPKPSNPNEKEALKPKVFLNKEVDFLGDGIKNSDTNIQSDPKYKDKLSDIYRLYLKIEGKKAVKSKPTDLLFVIDASSSMNEYDMIIGNNYNRYRISRIQAVNYLLNNTDLIPSFLKQDKNNRFAVIEFNDNRFDDYYAKRRFGYSYKYDARVLKDWSGNFNNLSIGEIPPMMATNYQAGLMLANDMLNEKKDPNRNQAMIFISDGVPTFYIDKNGDRRGTGFYKDIKSVRECMLNTELYIDEFAQAHPDLVINTVGVSRDINEDNPGTSQSPDVLKYMAKTTGGDFISVADDTDELVNSLKDVIEKLVSKVVVIDILSDKVDLFDKSDFKLIMKDKTTNKEITLMENGRYTKDNKNGQIVQDLIYDKNNKKITLKFNPKYELVDNNEYILSYNIKANGKAVEDYKKAGYDSIGDDGTDYENNQTSSKKKGFKSNKEAFITYNNKKKEYFPHPVVQIQGYELPKAGGVGIVAIKIIGALVLVLVGLVYVKEKKKS